MSGAGWLSDGRYRDEHGYVWLAEGAIVYLGVDPLCPSANWRERPVGVGVSRCPVDPENEAA